MSEPITLVADDRDPYAIAWGALIKAKRMSGRFTPPDTSPMEDGGTRQVDFARYLGVTQTAVSMWETGEQVPSATNQRMLVRKLGIAPDELWKLHQAGAA